MSSAAVASSPTATSKPGTGEAPATSTMKPQSNGTSPDTDRIDGEGNIVANGGPNTTSHPRHGPQHEGMTGSGSPVNGDASEPTHTPSVVGTGNIPLESLKRAECTTEKIDLLPVMLRRILNEIAATGMCPWLPWSRSAPRDQQARPPGAAHASSGGSQASDGGAPVSHLSGFMRENRSSMSAWTSSGARQNPQIVSALQQHAAALNQQHAHLHHRRFQSSSSSSPPASGPPRKKPRNGLFGVSLNRSFGDGKVKSRKRSLRQGWSLGGSTTTTVTTTVVPPSSGMFSPGSSVGGLASGSDDPEDASQSYDSESTSASDVSGWRAQSSNPPLHYQLLASRSDPESSSYVCQTDALREAAEIVLDYFFQSKGGYTMSPAEKAKRQRSSAAEGSPSPEDFFLQRRKRILAMFEVPPQSNQLPDIAPPYTIQRVAEVLLSPERYYSQTHKLCNALEKLLLVTSSTQAFGGYTGGVTAQSLREDQELSALEVEKRKIQLELRRRRLRHNSRNVALDEHSGAPSSGSHYSGSEAMDAQATAQAASDPESPGDEGYASAGSTSPEMMMEAAARASLRSKFDHVGMETAGLHRGDARPGSPPPPALSISASAAPAYVLPGHAGYSPPGMARTQSPTYLNEHHGPSSPSLDLASLHRQPTSPTERSLSSAAVASIPAAPSQSLLASVMMMMPTTKEVDVESRSSASSDVDSESDVSFDDSASDRSDGSDLDVGGAPVSAAVSLAPGTSSAAAIAAAASASAGGGPIEPFSSSRAAAALSRIQLHQHQYLQQQRLAQSRLLGTFPVVAMTASAAPAAAAAAAAAPPKESFARTPLIPPRGAEGGGGPSPDPSDMNRAERTGTGGSSSGSSNDGDAEMS